MCSMTDNICNLHVWYATRFLRLNVLRNQSRVDIAGWFSTNQRSIILWLTCLIFISAVLTNNRASTDDYFPTEQMHQFLDIVRDTCCFCYDRLLHSCFCDFVLQLAHPNSWLLRNNYSDHAPLADWHFYLRDHGREFVHVPFGNSLREVEMWLQRGRFGMCLLFVFGACVVYFTRNTLWSFLSDSVVCIGRDPTFQHGISLARSGFETLQVQFPFFLQGWWIQNHFLLLMALISCTMHVFTNWQRLGRILSWSLVCMFLPTSLVDASNQILFFWSICFDYENATSPFFDANDRTNVAVSFVLYFV